MYFILFVCFVFSSFSDFRNTSFLSQINDSLSLNLSGENDHLPSIGFVLSHPDDESMFFTPTLNILKEITNDSNKFRQIYFLYLSNGDYYNNGAVRETELNNLCTKYNYHCSVIDDPELKDGVTQWDSEATLKYINEFVNTHNIVVLFSFDKKGVSGHPNHIGTHYGVKLAMKSLKNVTVFYLESLNLFHKYSSFLSIFQLLFNRFCFISFSPLNVFKNMCIHKSQLRVHIPFWSILSSYSYINIYNTD